MRKRVGLQILEEHCGVLDIGQAVRTGDDRVIEDSWIVLANVVVGASLGVYPRETFEASVGHVFLVETPRNSPVFEEVDDRRDILGDGDEGVTVQAEVVTPHSCHVVGL